MSVTDLPYLLHIPLREHWHTKLQQCPPVGIDNKLSNLFDAKLKVTGDKLISAKESTGIQPTLSGKLYPKGQDRKWNNTEQRVPPNIEGRNLLRMPRPRSLFLFKIWSASQTTKGGKGGRHSRLVLGRPRLFRSEIQISKTSFHLGFRI